MRIMPYLRLNVENAILKIEKLEVMKDAESVGIEFFKQREEYEKS